MKKESLFDRLRQEERSFLSSFFVAPVKKNCLVHVSIAGVTIKVRVDHEGWGVFEPVDYQNAKFVREPTKVERKRYLEILPAKRLVLCNDHIGCDMDGRFYPITFVERAQRFDLVLVRTDGYNIWFDSIDRTNNRRLSNYLREQLQLVTPAAELSFKGLSRQYSFAYTKALESMVDQDEVKIKNHLKRGGAALRGFTKVEEGFKVDIEVEGQNYSPLVDKNLKVITAGICLTDHNTDEAYDTKYDLQSLVGVLKEGMNRNRIHRW